MFWQSIPAGFDILVAWQFWLVVVASSAVSILLVSDQQKKADNASERSSTFKVAALIARCLVTSFGVAALMPLLLGMPQLSLFTLIMSRAIIWIICVPIAVCVLFLAISIVPYLGVAFSASRPLQVFLEGLAPFIALSIGLVPRASVYPSIFATLGYLAVAIVLGIVALAIAGSFAVQWEQRTGSPPDRFNAFSAPFLCTLSGLLTLSMYASYVRLEIIEAGPFLN